LITRPRSPIIFVKKDYETEEEARAQQRAVEQLINENMNGSSEVILECDGFLQVRNRSQAIRNKAIHVISLFTKKGI
jgi:hypothetical protein